jgi:membrane protease YdiL (CAAX protease family)
MRSEHRHRSLAAAPVGAALLRRSMSRPPGSASFYRSTLALAAWWFLTGYALEPPAAVDRQQPVRHRSPIEPVAFGVGLFVVFYLLAASVGKIAPLRRAMLDILRFATTGSAFHTTAVALLTGAAEEFYFRGALYRACGDNNPVAATTAVYTAIAVPTMNLPMVVASAVMGTVFADQRRKSGGLQAPLLTHMVWSLLIARLLPRLFSELTTPS